MISVNKNLQLILPPDVGLGHDALQTITEFKKCVCLWIQARQKLQVNCSEMVTTGATAEETCECTHLQQTVGSEDGSEAKL